MKNSFQRPYELCVRTIGDYFKPMASEKGDTPAENGQKNFLLCLGTQKAGTSWLFDFLKDVESVHMGYTKELHVFDRQEQDAFLAADLRRVKSVSNNQDLIQKGHLWKRLSLVTNPDEYYNYFEHLLLPQNRTLTGDFTPEYSLLSVKKLSEIKKNFLQRGIKVKVIFLMRDPVERIWSAQRMTNRLTGSDFTLLGSYQSKYIEMLTRYEDIVPKIRSVFDEEDIYINFYENLFEDKTITAITKFLSLPHSAPNFTKRVNASKYEDISDSDRLIVSEYYAKTYDFVRREFPQIYPHNAWN